MWQALIVRDIAIDLFFPPSPITKICELTLPGGLS